MKSGVVLIFGGASHIGKAMVEKFAENYNVVFVDIDKEKAEKLIEENKDKEIYFFSADVTNEREVKEVVKRIIEKFGKIDILVNNVCGEKGREKEFLDFSLEEWINQFRFILGGAYLTCKNVLPEMIKAKKGIILNIASVSARVIGDEPAGYHIAKAGLIQFTKYLANKYGKFNIRANSISPGFIVKEQHLEKFNSKENENYRETAFLSHPLRKTGLAEDVANTALFLCSNDSSFITGQDIIVDGGLTTNDPWSLANSIRLNFEEAKKSENNKFEDKENNKPAELENKDE